MNTQTSSSVAPCPQTDRGRSRPGAVKRLLVAVDSSNPSRLAVKMAARLAWQLHADVVLLTVFSAIYPSTPEIGFIEPDVRAGCIAAGDRFLAELKAKMPDPQRVETVLREGDPATEIVRAAAIYNADLIIMGTHARGRLARAVLGSVADAVTQAAPCPVLTVAHPQTA